MKRKLLLAVLTAILLAAVLSVSAFASEATVISTSAALTELMNTPALWNDDFVLGCDIR